jgi:hypothetical protein
MTHRAIATLIAAVVMGVGTVATISTDAFARGGRAAVGRAGAYRGGARHVYRAPVRRGVAVGVGAAAAGTAAGTYYYGQSRCGYYPYPPCY